jgi:G8 domain
MPREMRCALTVAIVCIWTVSADAQVIHTPHDHVPNFAAHPTIRTATHGNWSSLSTWTPARLPTSADVVSIGHTVMYDAVGGDVDVIGIESGGVLRFATGVVTRLRVGTLLVLPNGTLEIGTSSNPVTASAELIIKNKPLDTVNDPDQYGTGLLSIDGTVTMHGAWKSPTFVRVVTEPRAGHSALSLAQPVSGWRPGDRIFLPDTRQVPADHWFNPAYALQVEERIVQSVSADGRTITVLPLAFDHRGARDADGTPTVAVGITLLPHVGNLTRNVVIRSESPAGTRGHTLFTARSRVSLSYVQFQDLGRTRAAPLDSSANHIGRYPLHLHHLWGPSNSTNTGYQFVVLGNAIADSLKWPIAVHGSHFGLIKQNVVYGGAQLTGAGIAIEDGTETENVFEENFVANIRGSINPRESGPSTADGTTPGSAAECFWAAGFNNRFIHNVASSCRNPVQQVVSGPGFKFILPAAPYAARNPRFRGADMTNLDQTVSVTPQHQPMLEFRGNEVYGLAADGLTFWQLGTDGYGISPPGMGESLVKDFRVWHTYEGAIWNYPAHRMVADGLVYRIDPAATLYWPAAFQCGDYRNIDITIRGGSIHAGSVFGGCTDPLGQFRIENVDAVARNAAFSFETPATPGTGADRPASGVTMTLRNNIVRAWPGRSLKTIEMSHNLSRGNSQPQDKYEVVVYDYQGQAGNNFRAYFHPQATQNLYGGIAPCGNTTARPEIDGITCPLSGTSTVPSPPTGVRIIR